MELRSLLAIRSVWVSSRFFSSVALSPATAGAEGVGATGAGVGGALAGWWGPGLGAGPGFGARELGGPGFGAFEARAGEGGVTSRGDLNRLGAAIWSSDRACWGVLVPTWRGPPIPWWDLT